MKKIIITEAQFKNIVNEELEKAHNKFPLSALVKVSKYFQSFKEFEHCYSIDINHGYYWHWTSNPKFKISSLIGPRDMSSMASGTEINKGSIMLTSDMNYWDAHYNQYKKGNIIRPYAVLFDASDIDPKYLKQVNRGFGNEIYVHQAYAPQLKQLGVYNRDTAKAIERKLHRMIPQSEEELHKLWEYSQSTEI